MRALSFHPLADIFPLIQGDEFAALVDDIRGNGLHEPIMLAGGAILDGRNRYRACIQAGVKPIFETYKGGDRLGYVISLNLRRRHLGESQRAMVAARLANMPLGGARYRSANLQTDAISQAGAAAILNVSTRSVASAVIVREKGVSELAALVDAGLAAVSLAAEVARMDAQTQTRIVARVRGGSELIDEVRAQRAGARMENIHEISSRGGPLHAKDFATRFPIIYADPPWRYEHPPIGGNNGLIENHYPTMTLDEICALGDDLRDLATDDAILYLWATAPKLAECISVIDAWGFDYRTSFVWVKDRLGMGYYARNQHELLLVARRGEMPPPPPAARVSSVIVAPRGAHSEKPATVYEMIESWYPTLAKIELFARNSREGWASWGNQVGAP